MEISSLYNTAKNFAETLKGKRPELAEYDACLCLIIADTGDIFSGVSTVAINEGAVEDVPAERIAVMSIITAKHVIAKQMIVISLDDYSYFKPEDQALSLLVNSSVDNSSCKVVLSPDEEQAAASLAPESAAPDFLSGYDELGAPADFASGIDVDSSNPFNAEDNKQDAAPNSLYEHPEEADFIVDEVFMKDNELYANAVIDGDESLTFRLYPVGENEFGRKRGMLKLKFGDGCLMFDDFTCRKR